MSDLRETRITSESDGSYEVGFQDGANTRQDVWRQYDANGTLLSECAYQGGQRHGLFKRYENGLLAFEQLYSNGSKRGYYRDYYPDGSLKEEGEYTANGIIVLNWWNESGEHTLINGDGVKYDCYGSELFRTIYKKVFVHGRKASEEKVV